MAHLSSTTVRTALIDYRAEQLRMSRLYPDVFGRSSSKVITEIDAALMEIEGNVTLVSVVPAACNP